MLNFKMLKVCYVHNDLLRSQVFRPVLLFWDGLKPLAELFQAVMHSSDLPGPPHEPPWTSFALALLQLDRRQPEGR
jgi:hypothetical protein